VLRGLTASAYSSSKPGSLSQPPRVLPARVNSLSRYFFLVFLTGFFFAILLFIIGLDLVAFLAFFITGIGTSCLLGCRWTSTLF
jgi:hypothetical protein